MAENCPYCRHPFWHSHSGDCSTLAGNRKPACYERQIKRLKAERDKYKKECEMHPMRAVEARCLKAEAERDRLRKARTTSLNTLCACGLHTSNTAMRLRTALAAMEKRK